MPHNLAGFLWGPMAHHLDHIAPLCALLQLPLIVTDSTLGITARQNYPDLLVHQWDCLEAPARVVTEYDALLTTLPRPMLDNVLLMQQYLHQKKIPSIWIPHGNSDKGLSSSLMEGLAFEENALFYGPKMVDFCKQKAGSNAIQNYGCIGNYRLAYYRKHSSFYRKLLQNLPKDRQKILYAPTWRDGEHSSSLEEALPHLIKNLPENIHLIIKPHPNEPCTPITDHPNITWLSDFPLIYPLLSQVDIYVGDMSSIGYDFLVFNRPMYFLLSSEQKFLNEKETPPILECGIAIPHASFPDIYQIIQSSIPHDLKAFATIRETMYRQAFTTHDSISSFRAIVETVSRSVSIDANHIRPNRA